MKESPDPGERPGEPVTEAFFAGAYARMTRIMVALAVVAAPVLAAMLGWRFALGFLAGALVGAANFYWLKSGVDALADVVTRTGERSTAGIVVKSLLRYGLLAIIVYVILRGSGQGIYGFFAGLFVPVAAMVCEGVYEAWSTLRHDV
ncbi:MAG: ATP synthase subunit I [Acidobacteriota bacterium]|nr:ATP synthase subunit I [Acidobacteriota bacterium]